MERRRLGRTGHRSTIAVLGGAAFSRATPVEAEAGFHLALDHGVNHLDVAPQYGDAEVRLGALLPAVRDRLFVAAKTLRRSPEGVRAQLEASLARLGTDHLDLYQLHAVTTVDVLDERMPALAEIERARDEGLVRFVGITGHNETVAATFLEALRRHDFDTVMFPVYPRLWADDRYRGAAEELLAVCAERDVGVMAIKAAAARPWADGERWATTWYEPARTSAAVARGVQFALSVPGVHALCTPGDLGVLPLALDAAERFVPLDDAGRAAAVAAQATEPSIFPIPT